MLDLTTFVIDMSTSHDTTLLFTLFKVQIKDNNNNETKVYSIRPLNRKLLKHYGVAGSKANLTQITGPPKIMFLQEEANSIVTDNILDSS